MNSRKSIKLNSYYVKNARKSAGHTQVSLASEMGISEKQIKRIENNEATKQSTANALCKALNVSLEHLQGNEGLGDYLPHIWCKSYFKGVEQKDKDSDIGNIYSNVKQVVDYIERTVDELFCGRIYSPCEYKVVMEVTLDKSNNTYVLDVRSSFNSNRLTPEFNDYRFEIMLFRFADTGMRWSKYNPAENNKFEVELQSYFSLFSLGIIELNSDKCKKVNDPFYAIQVILPTSNDDEPEYNDYINSENDKAFLFEKISSVEAFLHEIIKKNKTIEINKTKSHDIVLKGASLESDLTISMSRASIEQKKSISWPRKHLISFIDSLYDFNLELVSKSTEKVLKQNTHLNNLQEIALKHGALDLRPSVTRLQVNGVLLSDGLCN